MSRGSHRLRPTRIIGPGHALFAASFFAIGLLGVFGDGFAGYWIGVPKAFPARDALGWVCAGVALISGAGLVWRRTGAAAAGLLGAWLLAWMGVFKGSSIVAAPLSAVSWESAGETATVAAAAWVLLARLAGASGALRFVAGEPGLSAARTLYGLALAAFGVSHLAYLKLTASLVPAWVPAHEIWAAGTGLAYIAAGGAIILDRMGGLAATLAAAQIGLFTLLVWGPVIATGHADAGDRSEAIISWSLTAAAWVVAESYRRTRSAGLGTR